MSYLTGEPVPPGFEDEMSRTAIVQKQIEGHKGGALIGTEYVVEVHEDGQVRPDYFCVLCNSCNDYRSIFSHWISLAHRTNYLKIHYKKAFELLQQLHCSPNNSNELVLDATTNLVQLIEKHFGRSVQILAVAGDDFRRFRAKICSQVRDKFHYDECAGPDFINEVRESIKPADKQKLAINLNEAATIALDAISSEDDEDAGNFVLATPAPKLAPNSNNINARKKPEEQQPAFRAVNRSPPPTEKILKVTSPLGIKQQLPTPKELSMQASHIAQERYKWEKFRCLFELQLKQLRDETETYDTNPEKHPDYSEEWKLFWNRRYKQLQEEKKCDPNSYDYKPEWISYWKIRHVELFNIAVNKIQKDLKEKFKLGDEDEEHTKELLERYKIRVTSPKDKAVAVSGSGSSNGGAAATAASTATGTAAGTATGTAAAVRRKPNYRGPNSRTGNGSISGNDAVIDISDDEQQAPAAPSSNRPSRRPPYGRPSMSRSPTPKRGRAQIPSVHLGHQSRTRSPLPSRRRLRSRSRSRSPHHRSSRSPYTRGRDRSHQSRSQDDYGDRDRERDRERERDRDRGDRERVRDRDRERIGGGDYYRDRGRSDSYSRPTRNYDAIETFRVLDSRVYPEYSQPGQRSASPTGTSLSGAGGKDAEALEDSEGPLTVVSVLRMLSALEDHLGSLGPKALNLLSKALAMEKIKPNAADDLLLNEDNCVFMETTKEKLKGILIAEVLDDPQKVRVVKKLISNIATIIFQVTSKGTKESSQKLQKYGELANKKEFMLPFDRQIVSSKLASALIMNGLDDFSKDDINRLLQLFMLMAKTHFARRQSDRISGLNFSEVSIRLDLNAGRSLGNDDAGGSGLNTDIDIDISELMKEVEHQLAKEAANNNELTAKTNVADGSNSMESLTDSDLQTLLQNFKFLSNEEQVHLIGHLRKLEVLEPARVERLRKYVNISELSSDGESCSDYLSRVVAIARPTVATSSTGIGTGRISSSTAAVVAAAAAVRRKSMERDMTTATKLQRRNTPNFILDDDDDDDYNFDDLVMKANDSNGRKSNPPIVPVQSSPNALTFKPAPPKITLKDTENIIANLMGTLTNNSNQQATNSAKSQQQARNVPNLLQQQRPHQQQIQQQSFANNNGTGVGPGPGPGAGAGSGNYYNYGGSQISGGPAAYPHQQQQPPQQQQVQPSYNMANYNAYGPTMGHSGGSGGSYGGSINPWANGQPQVYNNMAQNFMPQQQQQQQQHPPPQQHFSNMFSGHQ